MVFFVTLFVTYIISFVACLFCYYFKDSIVPFVPQKLLNRLERLKTTIVRIVPDVVWSITDDVYKHVFWTRSSVLLLLNVFLTLLGHVILVVYALPYSYTHRPLENHVTGAVVCLTATCVLLCLCVCVDAGTVSRGSRGASPAAAYPHDPLLFPPGAVCSTCQLSRPPRSKHCRFLDVCVSRYDHYCTWVCNAIGAKNHRFFILYLLALAAMCINAAVLFINAARDIVELKALWTAHYIDSLGEARPMDWPVLIQTVFMSHPLVVFPAACLSVLAAAILGLLAYHLYLAATNQTTNERYKRSSLRRAGAEPTVSYSRGLVKNLLEVFLPEYFTPQLTPTLDCGEFKKTESRKARTQRMKRTLEILRQKKKH